MRAQRKQVAARTWARSRTDSPLVTSKVVVMAVGSADHEVALPEVDDDGLATVVVSALDVVCPEIRGMKPPSSMIAINLSL